MKKKIVGFGKLKLSKSNVASLNTTNKITGGETRWPDCKATQGFTCGDACCTSRQQWSCSPDPDPDPSTIIPPAPGLF
ncbi:hypothetical protein ACJD0Z_12280 [Flavobacteriaceae bacterium M23B6Z8]